MPRSICKVTPSFRDAVHNAPESLNALALSADLNPSQLSQLLNGQAPIGPTVKPKLEGIAQRVGFKPERAFKETEANVVQLLSEKFKKAVRTHDESQATLGACAGIPQSQMSSLMSDTYPIGPVVKQKVIRLGALLGLAAADCFREVEL